MGIIYAKCKYCGRSFGWFPSADNFTEPEYCRPPCENAARLEFENDQLRYRVRELEKQNYFLTEELSMVTEDRAVVLGRLRDTKSELKTLSDSIGNLPGRE